MAAYTTVTPVLSTKAGYLEDVRDQIITTLRFIIMNPGFTSSLWEEDMVSFKKLAAANEMDRNIMVNRLQTAVSSIFGRMFKDYITTCDFKAESLLEGTDETTDDGRYKIIFNVFIKRVSASNENDTTAEPALLSGHITVDPKTGGLQLRYEHTYDTHTLLALG